jgi:hypothetical protein
MQEYVQGIGRLVNKSGSEIYEGQFYNEFKNGYGRHIFDDGEYYIGSFKKDKRDGHGCFFFNNGKK